MKTTGMNPSKDVILISGDGGMQMNIQEMVIEFITRREENVIPIVPPGNALSDMILERKD